MKSSSGSYQPALDHLRGLAAFMVFCWHFVHTKGIIPLDGSASVSFPPLVLFNEGYIGVSLFMVLSGYLFASLVDGRELIYGKFLLNRALRILPLFSVVLALVWLKIQITHEPYDMLRAIGLGLVLPTMPQGGWSITVETHFYLLFPLLYWVCRKGPVWVVAVIAAMTALRAAMYFNGFDMEILAGFTMIGRIDQFLIGITAFRLRDFIKGRHLLIAAATAIFLAFMTYIDRTGRLRDPDLVHMMVYVNTVEGLFFGLIVAWYANSFQLPSSQASKFFAWVGQVSYSMYLLHFFIVHKSAEWIHAYVHPLTDVHLTLLAATLVFLAFLPVAGLSYALIERPFLRLRVPYLRAPVGAVTAGSGKASDWRKAA
jgi:peptidoglycan/LPS O-acetylase OafA/YrhL